jgi:hypothetical protein
MKAKFRMTDAKDPWVMLVLLIIREAKADVLAGPENRYYDGAVHFFRSGYYAFMLDFLSAHLPDFDPEEMVWPEGVEMEIWGDRE